MMEFSDQDLRLVLNRAMRSVAIAICNRYPRDMDRLGLALHADVPGGGRHCRYGHPGVAAAHDRGCRSSWIFGGGTESSPQPGPCGPFCSGFLSVSSPPAACFMLA